MSAKAEKRNAPELATPGESYDRVLRAVHWSTLLLIAAAFIAVWASHGAPSKEQHSPGAAAPFAGGHGLCADGVSLGAAMARADPEPTGRSSSHPESGGAGTEYVLYALMLVQPILGLLHTKARGRRVDLYFLGELPPIVGPDRLLAKQTIAAHDLAAYILLAVIGLHAAARYSTTLSAAMRFCGRCCPSPVKLCVAGNAIPLAWGPEAF